VERIEKCCVKFIKQRIIVQLQLYGIIIIIIIIGVNRLQYIHYVNHKVRVLPKNVPRKRNIKVTVKEAGQ
jgi:hypothetical protein